MTPPDTIATPHAPAARVSLSLTARLALLFAALTASLLIVVGIVISRAVEHHFHELDDHELEGKLTLVQNLLQGAEPEDREPMRWQQLDAAFAGQHAVAVLLRRNDGEVLHAIAPDDFTPAQRAGAHWPTSSVQWSHRGHQYIGRAAALALTDTAGNAHTVSAFVALDISHHIHFLERLRGGLWLGISAAALIAALLGWLAAHRGLAPLRRVTAAASKLSASRLAERLTEHDAPAEVRELVEAFNGMLARLESSFRRLADFSADIAHELRTPVSNLMTQTQVALSRARSAEEYAEVLASNMEEYERIARMVSDMLFIAQAEDGRLPRAIETVSLADETAALIEFYEALAEERGVRIRAEGQASVSGDRLMLRRALSNLLSNALRHTAAGGEIRISLTHCDDGAPAGAHRTGDQGEEGRAALTAPTRSALQAGGKQCVCIRISNPGETIPAEHLERIFDRFHRASADRQRRGEGAGLGLAITRSIIRAHGGEIHAESADGHTCFTITLASNTTPSGVVDTRLQLH